MQSMQLSMSGFFSFFLSLFLRLINDGNESIILLFFFTIQLFLCVSQFVNPSS